MGAPSERSPIWLVEASREFLDRLLDTMADPLFVKDEEHRFIAVNQALCTLMGQSRAEILGKSDFDFFPESEAQTFWEKDAEVFQTGGVNVNEEPITDAEGNKHVIVTKKAVFLDERGRKILVGTIRDVTDLARAQQELRIAHQELEVRVAERTREVEEAQARLRQAQKMEAVGQLTGGIAHDFNNLLAVVVGNLEMMRARCADDPALLSMISGALEASHRGATLTQHLLAFSRRQTLQPKVTDVAWLVRRMQPLLESSVGKDTILVIDASGDGSTAEVDPTQLETAILNLAINGRDAMPCGGKLGISVRPMDLGPERVPGDGEAEPGAYVLLEVIDEGVGMDAATMERVFEPFFTTKPEGQGSGLGLSMVYGFIKQSRGYISITSTVGLGSTIRILLPRILVSHRATPRRSAERAGDVPRGAGELILVVEDEPMVRRLTIAMLDSLGYRTVSAASPSEALELMKQSPVRLLLTDVILGGGSRGDALAEAMLLLAPDLRVVFMSGYAKDSLGDRFRDRGFSLLAKPFSLEELARMVRSSLP